MRLIITLILLSAIISGCTAQPNAKQYKFVDRESKIPSSAVKITAETDKYPPKVHSAAYQKPVAVPGLINTAGFEDSPFVFENKLYFFFTPSNIAPELQVQDEISGIYAAVNEQGKWSEPWRVHLQDPGKLALDGCEFIQNSILWFCSSREGFEGINWFTAELNGGTWQNWQKADFPDDYQVGELHIYGNILYFHSNRTGGAGGFDIWFSSNIEGSWSLPENVSSVNTPDDERQPFISADGKQLWFTGTYLGTPAVYKSEKVNGVWKKPKLTVSQFAGEPVLDEKGNLYFVHTFYDGTNFLEADIYVAYKK